MQKTRRTAAAATFSAVLVAGTVAGFLLTGGTARAQTETTCQLGDTGSSATATSCTIGTQGSPYVVSGYPVDLWLQAEASDPTTSTGDAITLTWGDTCEDTDETSVPEAGSTYDDTLTTANTLSATQDLTIGVVDASECSVWVTATATSKLGATDVITVDLDTNLGSAPTATATTATATASPTPTATKSTSAPVTVHQVHGYYGTCLDDFGNSSAERTKIGIWTCSSTDTAQSWSYSGDELKIHGMCVNAKGDGKSGSKLILWKCTGAANEIFVHNSKQEYVEKTNGWKYCIDDPGYSKKNGTQLFVYSCNNGTNQHFSLP